MAFRHLIGFVVCGLLAGTLAAPTRAAEYDAAKVAGLRPLLSSPDAEVRLQALKDLRQLSWPKEDPAYPEVLALLNDPDGRVRSYAAWQAYLKRDGDLAKPVLLDVLAGTDDAAALNAAGVVLQSFGLDDTDYVPALFALIDHPDQYVRWRSLDCIHRRQGAEPGMVPALARMATADDFVTARVAAVRLLGDLAPGCQAANEALITALDSGDAGVVTEASRLLEELGPAAAPAIPKLVTYLENECYDCLYTGVSDVLVELADVPELRGPITDQLLVLLKSDDKYLIHRSSKILGEMKTTDPRVEEVALNQLRGTFWESRQLGARLLADVFIDDPATIPPLLALLTDRDKYVREYAELAVAARGPAAAQAIPALVDNLKHFYAPVRANAVSALAAVGPDNAKAREAIRSVLGDLDEAVVLNALTALIGFGESDAAVVAALGKLCASETEYYAHNAELLKKKLAGGR